MVGSTRALEFEGAADRSCAQLTSGSVRMRLKNSGSNMSWTCRVRVLWVASGGCGGKVVGLTASVGVKEANPWVASKHEKHGCTHHATVAHERVVLELAAVVGL